MRIGNYQLLYELASGGMGVVHLARQLGAGGFSRLVAIKRLHAHLAMVPEFRDLVRDEANLAAQIRHPNVVPVIDVVEHEREVCLVLEYVPSVSLAVLNAAANAEGRPLQPEIAARIVLDVLAGLHAAHEVRDLSGQLLSIVHRDVSPQNVLVSDDGHAKLIDFGIAKAAVRLGRTKTGELKGKLSYMSPEQLRRKDVDRRADVFAAGALLFETLTGSRLFQGDDEGAIVFSILLGEPVDLAARGFSVALDDVLNKALATSRDDRFATAHAFEDALEAALRPASRGDVAKVVDRLCGRVFEEARARVRALPETADAARTSNDGTTGRAKTAPVSRSKATRALLPLVAALAAGGVVAGLLLHRPSSSSPLPASPQPVAVAASEASVAASATIAPASEASAAVSPVPGNITAADEPSASASTTARPTPANATRTNVTRPSRDAPSPLRRNPYH